MDTSLHLERAALASLLTPGDDEAAVTASLDELERLLDTAGGTALFRVLQQKETPDPATYFGSGKIRELRELCLGNDVTLVVFDTDLTPSQIKNIEDALSPEESDGPRVIDRSMLILDIFALHATSAEGKLQVELAQLKYTVPRLMGKGLSLSRQGGGNIAMRGPGESKLESDRRHVKRRIHVLEEQLKELEARRMVQRHARDRSGIFKVAIAGYTNAGKSTLLNRLTDAGILAEDKLFATLDPTTRKYTLPSGTDILLVDTVGFIRNLPTHLISAFRSTLEEVTYADLILVVIDASDPENAAQLDVTCSLLRDLHCEGKPVLYLYNKCDRPADRLPLLPESIEHGNVLFLSAATGEGVEKVVSRIEEVLTAGTRRLIFVLPLAKAPRIIAGMYGICTVENVDYSDTDATVTAVCDAKAEGMIRSWLK